MGDEKFAVDEIDVGFDRVEPLVQRVEQRSFVLVVVVGVSVFERGDGLRVRLLLDEPDLANLAPAARAAGAGRLVPVKLEVLPATGVPLITAKPKLVLPAAALFCVPLKPPPSPCNQTLAKSATSSPDSR